MGLLRWATAGRVASSGKGGWFQLSSVKTCSKELDASFNRAQLELAEARLKLDSVEEHLRLVRAQLLDGGEPGDEHGGLVSWNVGTWARITIAQLRHSTLQTC
jgi:hypothetical protein